MRIVGVTRWDVDALRRLLDGALRAGDLGVRGTTLNRLVQMGFASASGGVSRSYAITDDGCRYLDGLAGRGPRHWHLVVNGKPACQHGDIGIPYGSASVKLSEVELWAQRVREYAPGARIQVVEGDCPGDACKEDA